jgi:outer membrane protein OmpA-like peptidoglycan-associated protein
MHKLGLSLLITSMALVPYAALSQEASAPTADDYVCALTGECPDEPAESPDAAQPGSPRVSATRGFSLSRPTPTQPAAKATPTRRTTQRQTTRTTVRATRPVQQPGRVDLRLAFGPGSSALSSAAQTQVQAFAEALRRPQLANVRVRIEGHTDSSGGRAVNQVLSQKRAQAVADYLVSQGIASGRLEVRGYAYDRPLPGRPASARENRRVEAARIS